MVPFMLNGKKPGEENDENGTGKDDSIIHNMMVI